MYSGSAGLSPQREQSAKATQEHREQNQARVPAERRLGELPAPLAHRRLATKLLPTVRRRHLLRLLRVTPRQLQEIHSVWRNLLGELTLPADSQEIFVNLPVETLHNYLRSGDLR